MAPIERVEKKWDVMADKLIEAINEFERTGKWIRPWNLIQHRNLFTGTVYSGMNTFLLMMTPYVCPHWGTFNQWSQAGYKIKKGASAEVIFSRSTAVEELDDGTKVYKNLVSRPWYVYNGEQIEGYTWSMEPPITVDAEIEAALMAKQPRVLTIDNTQAYYSPSNDFINMPRVEVFKSAEMYYGTLAHELIHWSGHESRLNRDSMVNVSKEKENRPYEELVAEIGASILGTELGFTSETQSNTLTYITGWMTLLKEQKDALKRAASEAIQAVQYLR